MRRWARVVLPALALFACSSVVSCGDNDRATVTVFAASSLTDAFTEAARAFEDSHPGVRVRLSFASSAALRTQIQEGASADLLATADPSILVTLQNDGLVGVPEPFASNSLVIAVASEDTPVRQFSDLAKPGLRLVLAAPGVPLGDYSREVLDRAAAEIGATFEEAVLANVRSEEANARATLAKISLGEADAALVYATDIRAATGAPRVVDIPPAYNVVTEYSSATVNAGSHGNVATQFQEFLGSDEGKAILARWGFGLPRAAPS